MFTLQQFELCSHEQHNKHNGELYGILTKFQNDQELFNDLKFIHIEYLSISRSAKIIMETRTDVDIERDESEGRFDDRHIEYLRYTSGKLCRNTNVFEAVDRFRESMARGCLTGWLLKQIHDKFNKEIYMFVLKIYNDGFMSDVHVIDKKGDNELHRAIESNHFHQIKHLSTQLDLRVPGSQGRTPITLIMLKYQKQKNECTGVDFRCQLDHVKKFMLFKLHNWEDALKTVYGNFKRCKFVSNHTDVERAMVSQNTDLLDHILFYYNKTSMSRLTSVGIFSHKVIVRMVERGALCEEDLFYSRNKELMESSCNSSCDFFAYELNKIGITGLIEERMDNSSPQGDASNGWNKLFNQRNEEFDEE